MCFFDCFELSESTVNSGLLFPGGWVGGRMSEREERQNVVQMLITLPMTSSNFVFVNQNQNAQRPIDHSVCCRSMHWPWVARVRQKTQLLAAPGGPSLIEWYLCLTLVLLLYAASRSDIKALIRQTWYNMDLYDSRLSALPKVSSYQIFYFILLNSVFKIIFHNIFNVNLFLLIKLQVNTMTFGNKKSKLFNGMHIFWKPEVWISGQKTLCSFQSILIFSV